jgi:hypothetical protein
MRKELETFFTFFFKADVDNHLDTANFPTFEEALGLVDLAITREDSFKDFGNFQLLDQGSRLKAMSTNLTS